MALPVKKLNDGSLGKLQALESKIGYCIVAWEPQPPLARLSSSQLQELQAVETEMGAILVAYDCRSV